MSLVMSRGGRALTLVEVLVSCAILAGLALAILAATTGLTDATTRGPSSALDRSAMALLSRLRRQLRQSGEDATGDQVVTPAPGAVTHDLRFRMRADVETWSDEVTYARVEDGAFRRAPDVPRYRIDLTVGDMTTTVATDVGELTFERPARATIRITLVLVREPSHAAEGGLTRRTYVDEVEVLNRR